MVLVFALMMGSAVALGQGCSQCRDNTAATPPQTQAAYRRAIGLLVVAAGSVFVGAVLMVRRSR
jgi:hypothetical protein